MAVTAMLLVRRRAPEGSYFSDGDRASGVFGVLATGFSLLLGLIVFLAFTSYDDSKTGAEGEALAVVQQFETAQFLPAAARERLGGELICYGRSVIGQEWPRLETGSETGAINPWGLAMFTDHAGRPAGDRGRAVRLRQVVRPDLHARGGPARPRPRLRGRHPDAAVAGPVLHRRASSWSTCCSSPTAGSGRSPRAC